MHQQFLLQLLSPNEILPLKTADLLWDLHGLNLFITTIFLYVQHIMWKSEAVMDTVMENDAVPYWTLGCCEMSFPVGPLGHAERSPIICSVQWSVSVSVLLLFHYTCGCSVHSWDKSVGTPGREGRLDAFQHAFVCVLSFNLREPSPHVTDEPKVNKLKQQLGLKFQHWKNTWTYWYDDRCIHILYWHNAWTNTGSQTS